MPVQFAFAREQLARHLADAGGTWGGLPDPLAGPAPATVPSVLWNLSAPAERAALLADAGAEAPSQASPPPQSASGIDTSTIHHPHYRALSDANGGFWKHDPQSGVVVENHWMEVGTDVDGGTIYRMLTDYDVYGPGANNAFPPMNHDALLAMLAPRDALARPKEPPMTTNGARSAAAPRATTPAGQTAWAPPGSAAPPRTGDAEDIVVTARRTPVPHSPFHPLPPHHASRLLDQQGPLVQPPFQPSAEPPVEPEDVEEILVTARRDAETPYPDRLLCLKYAIWENREDWALNAAGAGFVLISGKFRLAAAIGGGAVSMAGLGWATANRDPLGAGVAFVGKQASNMGLAEAGSGLAKFGQRLGAAAVLASTLTTSARTLDDYRQCRAESGR